MFLLRIEEIKLKKKFLKYNQKKKIFWVHVFHFAIEQESIASSAFHVLSSISSIWSYSRFYSENRLDRQKIFTSSKPNETPLESTRFIGNNFSSIPTCILFSFANWAFRFHLHLSIFNSLPHFYSLCFNYKM